MMKRYLVLGLALMGLTLGRAVAADRPWIDVSVNVAEGKTPVYPGDPQIHFTYAKSMKRGDAADVSDLHMGAHTGTHVDAPSHFIPEGASIDQVPLSKLMGDALVIECSPDAKVIDATELNKHRWKGWHRLLFKTSNSYRNLYDDPKFHEDFVAIAPDAATLMADNGVELVGIDYNSVEVFGAKEPLTHRTLLGHGIAVVEGLDLRQVSAGRYHFICLPVKLEGRDAAPARAILQPL